MSIVEDFIENACAHQKWLTFLLHITILALSSLLAIDKITIDLPNFSLAKENLKIPYINCALGNPEINECRKIDMSG